MALSHLKLVLIVLLINSARAGLAANSVAFVDPPWIIPEHFPDVYFRVNGVPRKLDLDCPVSGKTNVTWFRDHQMATVGPKLKIDWIKVKDIGSYHCRAMNPNGTSISSKFEIKEALFEIDERQNRVEHLILLEGQALSVPCRPKISQPPANITWLMKGTGETRFYVDPTGTLHFPYVTASANLTTFLCFAKQLGESFPMKTITLSVKRRNSNCAEKPRVLYATQDLILKKDGDLQLFCIISGPSEHIQWTLPKNFEPSLKQGSVMPLRIDLSTLAVSERRFRVQCSSNGITNDVRISIQRHPYVHPLQNRTVLEGEGLSFGCESIGTPTPSIEWFFNGDSVDRALLNEGQIEIRRADFKHTGNYRCEASNIHGRSYSEMTLSVRSPRVHTVQSGPDCIRGVVGDSLTRTCEYFGEGFPTVTWWKGSMELTGISKDLRFERLELHNAGGYGCRVCEQHRPTFCSWNNFTLCTFRSEFVKVFPKPLRVVEDDPISLECEPRHGSDVVKWFIEGTYRGEGSIFSLAKVEHGVYTCKLFTDNVVSAEYDGLVTVIPRLPRLQINIACTDRSIHLNWTRLRQADFYELKTLSPETADCESRAWQRMKFTDLTSHTLPLSDCPSCEFKVEAVAGPQKSSTPIIKCPSTSESPGIMNPRTKDIKITRNQETNLITLSWKYPGEKPDNIHYRTCMQPTGQCSDSTMETFFFSDVGDPFATSFTVETWLNKSRAPGPLKHVRYACNLAFSFGGVEHIRDGVTEVSWSMEAEEPCPLRAFLKIDNETIEVNPKDNRRKLDLPETDRLHCVSMEIKIKDTDAAPAATSVPTCFLPTRAAEAIEALPEEERRGDVFRIAVPSGLKLIFKKSEDTEAVWSQSNNRTVELPMSEDYRLAFLDLGEGLCRISSEKVVIGHTDSHWLLWLIGILIVVSGVFIFVIVYLKKQGVSFVFRRDSPPPRNLGR